MSRPVNPSNLTAAPTPRLGLRMLVSTVLLVALASVLLPEAGMAAKKRPKPSYQSVSLAPYVGYWEGPGAVDLGRQRARAQVALSITEEVILFEVKYGRAITRGRLMPLGLLNGTVHLKVELAESKDLAIEIDQVYMVLQADSRGVVELRLEQPAPELPSTEKRRRRQPPPPPSKPSRILRFLNATLSQAQTLEGSTRPYGGSRFMRYADWRATSDGLEKVNVRREEADKRVAQDIQRLLSDGWSCLSQVNKEIPSHGNLDLTLDSPPGTPRLHLLYSRMPGPRIVYSANKQPAGYLRFYGVTADRNYPIVVSENGWTTQMALTTQPAPGSLERLPYPIPVSVFIFGKTTGDYGSGCQLAEFGLENTRQFNEYIEVLGGLVLAVGLEAVRRESVESDSHLLQALATIGRNEAIEASLHSLFPQARPEAIGYFGRWVGLLISQDTSSLSFFRDTSREAIVQQIQRDYPDLAEETEMVDLLVDLHLQRLALRRSPADE